jgi:uncharacterized membrane protein
MTDGPSALRLLERQEGAGRPAVHRRRAAERDDGRGWPSRRGRSGRAEGAVHHRLCPQRHRPPRPARPGVELITKPFSYADLAARIRDLLDGRAGFALGAGHGGRHRALQCRGCARRRIAPDPLTFIVWLFLVDWIFISSAALIFRRNLLAAAVALKWRYGVAAGALSILSFGSALYAFSLMETAKVSALRETSVVFAAALGSLLLGESFGARRIAAAAVLAAGLIVMQFGS